MKRLIRAQTDSKQNNPLDDGLSRADLEQAFLQRTKRLIQKKKYKAYDLGISQKTVTIPPYTVKLIRINTQTIDDSGRSFESHSRSMDQDRWEIGLYDEGDNLLKSKTILLPKESDINSLLNLEINKMLNFI